MAPIFPPLIDSAASRGGAMTCQRYLPPALSCTGRRRERLRGRCVCMSAVVKEKEGGVVLKVSDPVRQSPSFLPLLVSEVLCVSSPSLPPASSRHHKLQPHQQSGGDDDEERREYYVNLGDAIRTLREDIPEVFCKEPSFDIYRDDIVFRDPLNTYSGITNYKRIFSVLRIIGKLFFKACWLDITSIWQPVDNVIIIRWTAHGVLLLPWEVQFRFDATSEYKLDRKGKIYEHRVDNIAINSPPPKFRVLTMDSLILSAGCPSTVNPNYFSLVISSPDGDKDRSGESVCELVRFRLFLYLLSTME